MPPNLNFVPESNKILKYSVRFLLFGRVFRRSSVADIVV